MASYSRLHTMAPNKRTLLIGAIIGIVVVTVIVVSVVVTTNKDDDDKVVYFVHKIKARGGGPTFFGGQKTSYAYFKVEICTKLQLFTVFKISSAQNGVVSRIFELSYINLL